MNCVEDLVNFLHVDPAELPGAPTNEGLIAIYGDALLKKLDRELTPGERQGFLEMWRTRFITGQLGRDNLSDENLCQTEEAIREELYDQRSLERRTLDLRFLFSKVLIEQAGRNYLSE